jgi:hypothetical protein
MSVEDGIRSQLRNIESTYGRSIGEWVDLIRLGDRRRHGEIVAWLKSEYGLTHAAAHRVALVAIEALAPKAAAQTPLGGLYEGPRAALLPIHEVLMKAIDGFGNDIDVVPKTGYFSLRRRKQFAMIKPAAKHVDLGLILPGHPAGGRLESAATFNALFTHRVRLGSVGSVDRQVVEWIREAYDASA